MKRFWLLVLALFPTSAFAINQANTPPKFPLVWGANAGRPYLRSIPSGSQIGTQNCAASLNDGFPPLTFVPAAAGGCPPFGQDFNGILKQITQWSQWYQAGGPIFYDSAFASSAANGYPNGAIIQSAIVPGDFWMSTADNNTTNPDAGGANWVPAPGQFQTGMVIGFPSATILTGFVSANGLTLGNASSNATGRANADTQFLFAFIWNNCSNTQCPIYMSGGGASSRGANAAADYAANKAIAVYNMNGTGITGSDSQNGSSSTLLSGVPIVSGNSTTPGSIVGENLHSLIAAENGPHTHASFLTDPGHTHGFSANNAAAYLANEPTQSGGGYTGSSAATASIGIAAATTGITLTNASSGSGTGHNTVSRSVLVWWELKL
jgi:hypothetical protein